MAIDANALKQRIGEELAQLSDTRVAAHIRDLLVEPTVVLRNWDYGKPGEQFPCWAVLNDNVSKTGIAYCENGFGPRNPWGLVWLGSDEHPHLSIGMDSGWFPRFLDAYFESSAATVLPIWRVFKTGPSGVREAITNEDSWEATWEQVHECRKGDPASLYDSCHSISYKGW